MNITERHDYHNKIDVEVDPVLTPSTEIQAPKEEQSPVEHFDDVQTGLIWELSIKGYNPSMSTAILSKSHSLEQSTQLSRLHFKVFKSDGIPKISYIDINLNVGFPIWAFLRKSYKSPFHKAAMVLGRL